MADYRQTAIADFKRMMKLVAVTAVLMVLGALGYLQLFSTLNTDTVIATTLGVFFSILIGGGLFAVAFLSDKIGLDQQVTDATWSERKRARRSNAPPSITERNAP